jgi:hypothetical protein
LGEHGEVVGIAAARLGAWTASYLVRIKLVALAEVDRRRDESAALD